MRTRPLAAAVLLALAPLAAAPPCRAQAAAEDPTTDMARARFKEGVGFFDKGQYEQARAAFLQAYALKKHPAVLLNLAWSSLKSAHSLEAQRYFRQFLSESKDITDKQHADANDGLNQANAKLGRIEVMAPVGTEVTVDGDKAGIAPLAEAIMVEPGAHTIKFKGSDGATDSDSVTVLAGEKVIAHFAKTAAVAPAAPPTVPTGNPDDESPAPAPPPSEQVVAKPVGSNAAASSAPQKSIFAAPANMVPVIIGGAAIVAGVGVAIGMAAAKQSAQSKANDTATQIKNVGGTSCNPPGPPSVAPTISDACGRFISDNGDVNTDATIGNFAIGIGAVAAAATILYWLLADKIQDSNAQGPGAQRDEGPSLAPVVGRSRGGFSLSGRF